MNVLDGVEHGLEIGMMCVVVMQLYKNGMPTWDVAARPLLRLKHPVNSVLAGAIADDRRSCRVPTVQVDLFFGSTGYNIGCNEVKHSSPRPNSFRLESCTFSSEPTVAGHSIVVNKIKMFLPNVRARLVRLCGKHPSVMEVHGQTQDWPWVWTCRMVIGYEHY